MHVCGEKLQIGQNFEFVGIPYPPLIRGKFVIELEKLSLHFLAKIHLDKCHIVSPLRDQKLQYDQFWNMHFRGWAPTQLINATVHPHQWGKPDNQPVSNLHNNVSSWLILLTARIKSASSLGNNFHIFHHRNQVSSSSGSFSFHYCNQHTVSVRDIGLHTDTLTMYNKYQLSQMDQRDRLPHLRRAVGKFSV